MKQTMKQKGILTSSFMSKQVNKIITNTLKRLEQGFTIILRKFSYFIADSIPVSLSTNLLFITTPVIKITKKITSRPFMRAMSTVDHKRIRVMYLMFRLCASVMRV